MPQPDTSRAYRGTVVSRGRIVPLISSYVTGPLGVPHLPRLWLKALLHERDILAEDWGCGPGGLDRRIMECTGIDGPAFMAWLMQTLPTYDETEQWVRENATNLTATSVGEAMDMLRTMPLPKGLNEEFRSQLGIMDASVNVGVTLNNYDDWQTVHAYIARHQGELEPIVPAISPTTCGLIGIPHLPRLWLKLTLIAARALPEGYRLAEEPSDARVIDALGIQSNELRAYVFGHRPTYGQFETFIVERAGPRLEGIVWDAIVDQKSQSVLDTHAYDWALLREQIIARPPVNQTANAREGIYAFEASGLRTFRPA